MERKYISPMYSFPRNKHMRQEQTGILFLNAPGFGDVGFYTLHVLKLCPHEMPLDLCKTPWNVQKICEEARKFRAL